MQHCDPDALALLALGEDADVDHEHLRSCDTCRTELEALRSVVTIARTGPADAAPVRPPDRVWAGIAAATGVTARPRGVDADAVSTTPAVAAAPDAPAPVAPAPPVSPAPLVASGPEAAPDLLGTGVADLAARRADREADRGGDGYRAGRRWPGWALAAAAAVGVLAGGGVVGALTSGGPDDGATTVTTTALEPLEDPLEAGEAVVLDRDGDRLLRVTATGLPDEGDAFLQVWLLDAQAQRMVPLGVLRGSQGEYLVPAGLDLGDFPVVDVSVEPVDGDPTHSGHSLLRGTLGA